MHSKWQQEKGMNQVPQEYVLNPFILRKPNWYKNIYIFQLNRMSVIVSSRFEYFSCTFFFCDKKYICIWTSCTKEYNSAYGPIYRFCLILVVLLKL